MRAFGGGGHRDRLAGPVWCPRRDREHRFEPARPYQEVRVQAVEKAYRDSRLGAREFWHDTPGLHVEPIAIPERQANRRAAFAAREQECLLAVGPKVADTSAWWTTPSRTELPLPRNRKLAVAERLERHIVGALDRSARAGITRRGRARRRPAGLAGRADARARRVDRRGPVGRRGAGTVAAALHGPARPARERQRHQDRRRSHPLCHTQEHRTVHASGDAHCCRPDSPVAPTGTGGPLLGQSG